MYDYYSVGKILVQEPTNGSCKITRHFQQKRDDLFHGFEFICGYIDDMLILTKGDWKYHIQKLELTINKLNLKGLKYNIERSFFGQT